MVEELLVIETCDNVHEINAIGTATQFSQLSQQDKQTPKIILFNQLVKVVVFPLEKQINILMYVQ